jgi:D-alanyl-D-alanine carboxypeptidase
MKKIALALTIATAFVWGGTLSTIDDHTKARMIKGNSWRAGCPVGIDDLRYLEVKYRDFNGGTRKGELIVHKDVARSLSGIFEELYAIGYPIYQMKLVSDYHGSDYDSIEADNTSAHNCRKATGSQKWSKHAFGKAIDINPIENPYISRNGKIVHRVTSEGRNRYHSDLSNPHDKAVLLPNDKAVRIFKKYGWSWGGDWRTIKDYQHFEYGR